MTTLFHRPAYLSSNIDRMTGGDFPAWFRRQLDRREWNMSDFARRADISPSVVARWASGERVPSPASCDLISDVFGVNLDTVLLVAGHRPDPAPDDPPEVADLVALLRRIRMDRRKEAMIRANLLAILAFDEHEAGGQSSAPSS